MNTAETEFLALTALGMFTVDSAGAIWRHMEWTRGSKTGSEPALVRLRESRRADVSTSGQRTDRGTSYLRVMFVSKGARHTVNAHRIVWMLANGQPIPDGLEVNHRNGDGLDNRPENLEIVTGSQNVTHAIRVLGARRKSQPGSRNSMAKITEEQAAQIKHLASLRSMPQWKIAEMFGISQQTVAN